MKTNKNTRTPKTKKAHPQTFKVQYADRELNFLNESIFQANSNIEAKNKAAEIAAKKFGDILEVYSLIYFEGVWLWRAV